VDGDNVQELQLPRMQPAETDGKKHIPYEIQKRTVSEDTELFNVVEDGTCRNPCNCKLNYFRYEITI
jgi:hypothetical protein